MHRSLLIMIGAMLMLLASSAWSDCACFCVDGELKTMCTSVDDAQQGPTLCPPADSTSCPQDDGASSSASYESPDSSAVNCRDVRVYDAIRREYIIAKACDVI